MAIPVRKRGLDKATMQAYEDTLLYNSMNAHTEYWVPNALYYDILSNKIKGLRHELSELEKESRTNTSQVVNLLNRYALDLKQMENNTDYFRPYLKDPDLLTDKQLRAITDLLGRFKKNASSWGENFCKRFLCCDSACPLKIRKEQLQYVCYIMQTLSLYGLINPNWKIFTERYKLFVYDKKVDARTLTITTSNISKQAKKAQELLGTHYHLSKKEQKKRRDEVNKKGDKQIAKYRTLNELDGIIKSLKN